MPAPDQFPLYAASESHDTLDEAMTEAMTRLEKRILFEQSRLPVPGAGKLRSLTHSWQMTHGGLFLATATVILDGSGAVRDEELVAYENEDGAIEPHGDDSETDSFTLV